MKAVFVSYDQAHADDVQRALGHVQQRGFTLWEQTQGRGSVNGDPHLNSHAWPSNNASLLTFMEDAKVKPFMDQMRRLDADHPLLGLRAFVLPVEDAM